MPFPGYPDSYVTLALDAQGTMIEVHPFGTALFPGDAVNETGQLRSDPTSSHYTANHTAISVPVSAAKFKRSRSGKVGAWCAVIGVITSM